MTNEKRKLFERGNYFRKRQKGRLHPKNEGCHQNVKNFIYLLNLHEVFEHARKSQQFIIDI